MKKRTYEIPALEVSKIDSACILSASGNEGSSNSNALRSGTWGTGNDPATDGNGYYLAQ